MSVMSNYLRRQLTQNTAESILRNIANNATHVVTRTVAAGFGRHGMPLPASNDIRGADSYLQVCKWWIVMASVSEPKKIFVPGGIIPQNSKIIVDIRKCNNFLTRPDIATHSYYENSFLYAINHIAELWFVTNWRYV